MGLVNSVQNPPFQTNMDVQSVSGSRAQYTGPTCRFVPHVKPNSGKKKKKRKRGNVKEKNANVNKRRRKRKGEKRRLGEYYVYREF